MRRQRFTGEVFTTGGFSPVPMSEFATVLGDDDLLPVDAEDIGHDLDACVADELAVIRLQRAAEKALQDALTGAVSSELAERAALRGNLPLAARLATQGEGGPMTPDRLLANYKAAALKNI